MSYIDKLKIQGIRSFSPTQPAVIQFYRPLTFIVGPNGCGKTTTIECLRYATTGQLPPGSDGGRNFVHDPSIAGETNVSSSVSLKFMGKNGRPMKVTRIAEVAMKKTKLSFTSKDTTIQLVDEHGATKSYNHKVKDANTMIPEFLSVPKSVLDNVIFTHQEESNWPLGDNKELKNRFDQIFESTRYTKALEDLQKQKKEKKQEGDDSKRDLDVIRANLSIFCERRNELEKVKREINGLNETKVSAEKELDEITTEMQTLSQKRLDGQALKELLQTLNVKLEQKMQESQRAYDDIDQEYNESLAQLKILVRKLDFNPDDTASKIEALNLHRQQLLRKREIFENEKDRINTRFGKLTHELSEGEKLLNIHFQNMINISRRYSLPGNVMDKDSITLESSKKLLRAVKGVLNDKKQLLDAATQKFNNANEELIKIKQAEKLERENYERQLSNHKASEIALKRGMIEKREELNSGDRVKLESQRKRNECEILKSKKKLEDFKKSNEEEMEMKKIKELNMRKNDLNSEIKSMRVKCDEYERNAILFASIEQKKDAIDHEFKILTNIQTDIEADLKEMLGSDDGSDVEHLCERVESHLKLKAELYKVKQNNVMDLKTDFKADVRKHQDLKAECQNIEALVKAQRNKLNLEYLPIVKELSEDSVVNLNKETSEKCVSIIKKKLSAKEDVYHLKNAMIQVIEKAGKKAREEHSCFLCKREFNHEEENAFLQMLNKVNQDDSLETAINDLKMKAKSIEEYHFSLINDILPNEQQIAEKRMSEIQLAESLNEKKIKLEEEESNRNKLLEELENARKVHGPAQKYLDQLKKYEIKKEEYEEEVSKLSFLNVGCSGFNSQQLLEDARCDKNAKETEKEEVEELIQKSQKNLDASRHKVRMETNIYQQLLEKKNEIEHNLNQSAGIEEKIQHLTEEIQKNKRQLSDLKETMKVKRNKLADGIILKTAEKEKFDNGRKECEDAFNTCEQLLKEYEQTHTNIVHYFSQELQQQLDELHNVQKKNKDSISKISADVTQIQNEVETLSSQKDDSKYRNLMHNIRFKELEEEIHTLKVEIEVQQSGLSALNVPYAKQRYEELQRRERELNTTLASDNGRRKVLAQQETNVANALRNPQYHKIEEKHSEKIIEYETLAMTVKDLDKYYKALDSALHQYHSTKIIEINTYIKELWRLTYKGGDIDTIEIQSDAKEKTGGRGRNYNYRLVMTKGGSTGTKAINMRGHCSAGQKVLASLIVRLALAETFCGECGIFCLDEPTTNLDEANKRGFAEALQQILESRKNQKNFQLIVITHDEEFMDYLASQQELGGGLPEAYFRIQRETDGNSMHYHSVARRVTFK